MYAVMVSGGKQYRVSQNDTILIEKIDREPESVVEFETLMLGSDAGVRVGTPILDGVKVTGRVLGQVKGEKIVIYKYKSKKNYHRKMGHRQTYTKVQITGIGE